MSERVSIVALLSTLDAGGCDYEFGMQLAEVVKAVKEHQKKGKVSLTITIEPQPKFGKSAVSLSASIKADVPRPDARILGIKFINEKGLLVGTDPNQQTFGAVETTFKAAGE